MNIQVKKALFTVALNCLFLSSAMADVIKLRADSWMPFNGDPGSANPGYIIEVATKVFATAGHQVEYKTLNWARTCKDVASGKIDGAVGAGHEDVPTGIFHKEEFGKMQISFFVRKGFAWK